MELQQKISNQETIIRDLKSKHDSNLKHISIQLFSLQRSLMEKENHLSTLIREREQVSIVFLNKVLINIGPIYLDYPGATENNSATFEEKFAKLSW